MNNPNITPDSMGKRMPYTVPDGFFDDMQKRIIARTVTATTTSKSSFFAQKFMRYAAAASVAIVLIGGGLLAGNEQTPDFDQVASAYDNLNEDDRQALLSEWQDDNSYDWFADDEDY